MRLALFSDIHGNLAAFEAALTDFDRLTAADGPVDVIWVLGDLAAFGPYPSECIARVRAWADAAHQAAEADPTKAGRFRAVRGNTDRYLIRGERPVGRLADDADKLSAQVAAFQRRDQQLHWGLSRLTFADYEFLGKLSSECDLHVPGYGHVIGYHGTPGSDEAMLTPASTDEEAADALLDREGRLAIGAHIHVQMDRVLPTGWRVINIGSVGMSFDKPGYAQWALITFAPNETGVVEAQVDLRAVPYDVEAVAADLAALGFPGHDVMLQRLRSGQ